MKNYKLAYYAKKNLNYTVLMDLQPNNLFLKKTMDVNQMTYGEVKGVRRELSKPHTWEVMKNIFETCYKLDENQFWKGRVIEFFAAFNYIKLEFLKTLAQEKRFLSDLSTLDAELWKEAGGDSLNVFSDILPIIQLGKIYSVYPFDLESKKYQQILVLLTIEKKGGQVDRKYNELKKMIK